MLRTFRFLALSATVALTVRADAQGAVPTSGAEVFARMRAAYAKGYYSTLTFRQTTTIRQRDGRDTVQTWYEKLRYTPERGTQLRIDVAPLENGNASISTWDSTWVIRADTLAAVRAGGNPFLVLIESAYMQPADRSVREIAPLGIDLGKVRSAEWQGQPVWVVGSASAADTTSPQFWVETKRLMVVRILLGAGPTRPPMDVHLENFVACGKGWLAAKVTMFADGARRQGEEYHDWACDGAIDPRLFDPPAKKK